MSAVGNNGALPFSIAAGAGTPQIALAAPGRLIGVVFAPTAAVSPVITVFDSIAAASGTTLATFQVEATVKSQQFWFGDEGIDAQLGIVISGVFTTLPLTVYTKRR